jgi:hypothetical protein
VGVRGVAAFAALALAAMVVSYSWVSGRDVAGEMARQSLTVRAELVRAGLRVLATRPIFGIGLDRFYLEAAGFASPELRALWTGRMNPHNDFLRFGAELGLVGLGLFVWILVSAARRIWTALRATRDAALAGLAGGLTAFLVTSLVSNPLMVRDVSYVFWLALGLAVGQSSRLVVRGEAGLRIATASATRRFAARRVRWTAAAALAALLVLSIPVRARQEIAAVDLAGITYGLFDWGAEPDGTRSRWSGPRATVFVDSRARVVEIPLLGTLPTGARQQVEVIVDGRLANRVSVGPEWQRLRTLMPPPRRAGAHRIDLVVSPVWIPADSVSDSDDRRVLGVKVGDVEVSPAPGR